MKVKITKNRPYYDNILGCYVVKYKVDAHPTILNSFDTYSLGIEFIKTNFPDWFAKHFK